MFVIVVLVGNQYTREAIGVTPLVELRTGGMEPLSGKTAQLALPTT
jgi:hypothetical protein